MRQIGQAFKRNSKKKFIMQNEYGTKAEISDYKNDLFWCNASKIDEMARVI